MNPFDIINSNQEKIIDNNIIELWKELLKRKKNTFILGWTISENELKEHIKIKKKKIGCNGNIKKKKINEVEHEVVLFQGDHIDFIKNYLINYGIDKDNIIIKG